MIIDSYQHFCKYQPIKYEWIDNSMSVIRKDFSPSDFQKIYAENGIDLCIKIQADQTLGETDFRMDLAHKNDFLKGIVGCVDLGEENIERVSILVENVKTFYNIKN